jgi:hypothetical protein
MCTYATNFGLGFLNNAQRGSFPRKQLLDYGDGNPAKPFGYEQQAAEMY